MENRTKKNAKIALLGKAIEDFNNAKSAMSNFTRLNYVKDDNAKMTFTTDASSNAMEQLSIR